MAQTCALFKPFSQLLLKAWHQRLGQPSDTVQLLNLAIALEMAVPDEWLLALLENGATTEAIIGVLKLLSNPTSLPVIERLSQHEQWQVRTQVASALGRIGTLAQWSILEKLITDPQWWVRYRAAQAMTCCDAVSHDQLQLQATQWTDRFAKDMLNQVLAQRRNHYVD
jgi:HEAT repeat protein